jgi:hypothetical protein
MKTAASVAGLLALAAACAFAGITADAQPLVVLPQRPTPREPMDEPMSDAPSDSDVEALGFDIAFAAKDWPEAVIPHAALRDVANDIAMAVLHSGDPAYPGLPVVVGKCPIPMDRGDWRMTNDAEARGILSLALAYFEGARFASYVDEELCNDRGWRKDGVEEQEGTLHRSRQHGMTFQTSIWTSEELLHIGGHCDGGLAFSFWQVHIDSGLLSYDPHMVTAEKMKDRVYAASVGLAMACRSLKATGSLVGYTGERLSFHPKADERLNFARRFMSRGLQQE